MHDNFSFANLDTLAVLVCPTPQRSFYFQPLSDSEVRVIVFCQLAEDLYFEVPYRFLIELPLGNCHREFGNRNSRRGVSQRT